MVLSDLSAEERSELAAKVGCSAKYLYQLATSWQGRRPGPDLARKLVAANPRLSLEGLLFPPEGGGRTMDAARRSVDKAAV